MAHDISYPREDVPVVNMHEAKTHLSRLVAQGEFIIARNGKPVARVTPIGLGGRTSRLGFMPGIHVPDDFYEMMSEEIAEMFGVTGE